MEFAAFLPFIMATEAENGNKDIHWLLFSDCMYLSCEIEKLGVLIDIVSNIQMQMLVASPIVIDIASGDGKKEIKDIYLLRGAMTYGEIKEFSNLNAVGKAINKAYQLESQNAIYPRIIIDTCLKDNVENRSDIAEYEGWYYVDYIKNCKGKGYPFEQDIINKMSNFIDSVICKSDNESIVKKYKWLKEYIHNNN